MIVRCKNKSFRTFAVLFYQVFSNQPGEDSIHPIFVHFDGRLHILCIFRYYSNTVLILYNAYTTGFEIFVKKGQIGQVNVEKC